MLKNVSFLFASNFQNVLFHSKMNHSFMALKHHCAVFTPVRIFLFMIKRTLWHICTAIWPISYCVSNTWICPLSHQFPRRFNSIRVDGIYCAPCEIGVPDWKKNAHLANISFCSVSAKKNIYIIIIKNPPKFTWYAKRFAFESATLEKFRSRREKPNLSWRN